MKNDYITPEARTGRPNTREGESEMKAGRGWAWAIDSRGHFVMCNWVEPSRGGLIRDSRPSPEAKPIHVAIVPMKLWRKLSAKGDQR